jgi:hypothetical protein
MMRAVFGRVYFGASMLEHDPADSVAKKPPLVLDDLPAPVKARRRRVALRWIALAVVAALLLSPAPIYSKSEDYCVVCRQERAYHRLLPFAWTTTSSTPCSRWYAANVEPTHVHLWDAKPKCTRLGNFLTGTGYACRMSRYPVQMLPPDSQLAFYRRFQDPREAKALFIRLTDPRLNRGEDDERGPVGYRMVRTIRAWERAGFTGTWDAWWERFDRGEVSL